MFVEPEFVQGRTRHSKQLTFSRCDGGSASRLYSCLGAFSGASWESKPRVRSKLVALNLASYTKVERHIVSQQEIEPSFLPACLPYGDIFIIWRRSNHPGGRGHFFMSGENRFNSWSWPVWPLIAHFTAKLEMRGKEGFDKNFLWKKKWIVTHADTFSL